MFGIRGMVDNYLPKSEQGVFSIGAKFMISDSDLPSLLVADDDAIQLAGLCDTLEKHGYRTTGVGSAREALNALASNGYDLLLTDMRMPGMDGIDLLRAALEADPELVCIVMTGEGTIETAVNAMKAGALDYILKPFRLSTVLPVLSRAVGVRRLRREKAALEQSVRQRTEELVQANRELDAFAHSVSHDLRTPLNAIIGFSDLLQKTTEPPLTGKALEFAKAIHASGRRMNALIDDLLRLSQVSRCNVAKLPVDLSLMAEQVVDRLRAASPDRSVDVQIAPALHTHGDEGLLRIVLENLLGNAWKYSGKTSHACISFNSARLESTGNVFQVRDNGAGFDMASAKQLFEPFKRMHKSSEFPGTGLGLSIVRRVIERHGGRIWAESTPGEGACFSFTLD